MDETRTILITTHQVEEVENLLTDVIFIDKGRIVLDCSLEDIADALRRGRRGGRQARRRARREARSMSAACSARRCCTSSSRMSHKLARLRRGATPSVSDLFVAKAFGRRRMNTYLWLIRREFWENRAIWMIPAAIGVR